MKKLIFPIVCCFISMTVSAQLVKQQAETQKKGGDTKKTIRTGLV